MVDCKPGQATVFSKEEENELVDYVVQMANMGFGLTRGDLQLTAYCLAERPGKSHPFLNEIVGRGWLEEFLARHPKVILQSTQPLSYSRAVSANPDAISDHFAKLGSMYARLNILSKPMQIYYVDECGVSVVHKGGKRDWRKECLGHHVRRERQSHYRLLCVCLWFLAPSLSNLPS